MSCVDIQDSLVEYLLGELDAVQRANVEKHLASECGDCKAEFKALSESVDLLWQAVPNARLSESLQRSIVARACAPMPVQMPAPMPAQMRVEMPVQTSNRSQLVRSPIVQAMLAFAAGILCMICLKPSTTDFEKIAKRNLTTPTESKVNLASPRIPDSLEMSEKKYESTHLVALRRKPGSDELRGHVLWDTLTREIHIFCFGLQQPPHGTQYALWLIGPGNEVRIVERLEVDSEGVCKAAARWPAGDFRYAKVTLEPSSKFSGKPSDDVHLTSNAIQPFSY